MTRTRTPRKNTAKRTNPKRQTGARKTPALSLSLVTPPTTETTATLIDLRYALPVRRRNFVGPYTPHQIAGARAAQASAALMLPIPVSRWNGPTATLADGTLLTHNDHPGHNPTLPPPRHFTAHIACRHGGIHTHRVTSTRDLAEARAVTRACGSSHADTTNHAGTALDWDKAINRGVGPVLKPKPSVVVQLQEGVRRAKALHDDTEPLSLVAIADGLAERAQDADTEQPKEHPEP